MICSSENSERKFQDKSFYCSHHLAHLWSAWGISSFADSLLVSLDGSGDRLSGMVGHSNVAGISEIRRLSVDQSLGNLYSDAIRFLGYRRFDEYKVMGLAPYGDADHFKALFKNFFMLLPEGNYNLIDRSERWGIIHDAGLLPHARRAGQPFLDVHKDFAASLQWTLEEIALHVLNHFAASTGYRRLCYAGGVAHNCTLNGRILYSHLFEEVYIQPAAHDSGGALGAALNAAYVHDIKKPSTMPNLYLGSTLPDPSKILSELEPWSGLIHINELEDPAITAADLISAGQVIAWVQGRSEFGPRALGNRSILADPRPAENRERINAMIKQRESYRPFAPSILLEHIADIVQLPSTRADLAFMTFTLRVNKDVPISLRP
jgi:carbamoyltransferase